MGEKVYYNVKSGWIPSDCKECGKHSDRCLLVEVEIPCNSNDCHIYCADCLHKLYLASEDDKPKWKEQLIQIQMEGDST